MAAADRKYPTTGYWLFVCNTGTWRADEFLATDETDLLYSISKHHRFDIQPGQRGVLRLNKRQRSRAHPGRVAGIYAVLEVIGRPALRIDSDTRFYVDRARAAEPRWRVPIRITGNLLDKPIDAAALPDGTEFEHIRRPLQTSTLALKPEAFEFLLRLSGVPAQGDASLLNLTDLEATYADATPEERERISKRIERGPIGEIVKTKRGHRCQICEHLGRDPIAFHSTAGVPFAEAHHVVPVSRLVRGSLGPQNIMVLCPNHHRQAHHGRFKVAADSGDHWTIELDGSSLKIEKTRT